MKMENKIALNPNIKLEDIVEMFQRDDVCYETENSAISKFYTGKSVFLTGGTGFLGKLLIEKLLRACPDITCIFMLARPKKGKDPHTRMDEIFNDLLFSKVTKLQPKFRHKVVLINGDISLPGLGMSIEDRKLITEKATVFIHSAATVKFNEKLSQAVDINVKGTIEMISLAKECQHLDCFVHVSTIFSHCPRSVIGEEIYNVPFDADRIIQICNATPPALLEKIVPDLLGKWPNTYVFTKAIGENCVRQCASQLPICIVRPSIVVGTYKEPVKIWIDNIYGPTGIVVGAGVGLLRIANLDEEGIAEIVPGDMVVNLIIAASYKTATEKRQDIPIYNFVACPDNKMNWKDFMAMNAYYGIHTPCEKALWTYSLKLTTSTYLYYLYAFFAHFIPALLMDTGLLLVGKKPQLLAVYKKIHTFGDTLKYFTETSWTFTNTNTQELYRDLSEEDKKLFFFDMSQINWIEYFTIHCIGLRTHLLKEDIATIPQARKKNFRFLIAHKTIKFVIICILLRLLYMLVSYISSYF